MRERRILAAGKASFNRLLRVTGWEEPLLTSILCGLLLPALSGITYDANALPLPQVLAALSQKTGRKIAAVPLYNNDFVILHLEKAPIQLVLDELAKVEYGRWVSKSDGHTLERDTTRIEANERKRQADNQALIQHDLDVLKRNIAFQGTFDSQAARRLSQRLHNANQLEDSDQRSELRERIEQAAPLNRSIDRILVGLSAELLASIPDGKRVVFSEVPTPMQRPLPDGVAEIIRSTEEEQNLWNDAAIAEQEPQGQRRMSSRVSSLDHDSIAGTKHVLLTLERSEANLDTVANLTFYDASGEPLTFVTEYLTAESYPLDITGKAKPRTESDKEESTQPLSSDLTPAIHLLCRQGRELTDTDRTSLLPRLTHIEKSDPSSLLLGPALLSAARTNHRNLIALAQDYLLRADFYIINGGFAESSFSSFETVQHQTEIALKDGWWTISPKYYQQDRKVQMDRVALGAMLNEAGTGEGISLDREAEFVFNSPSETNRYVFPLLVTGLDPAMGGQVAMNDWDYLRFYGSLRPDQRSAQGAQSLSSLDADQLELVNHLVYDRTGIMQDNQNQSVVISGDNLAQGLRNAQIHRRHGVQQEPTMVLPNGLSAAMGFTLHSTSENGFLAERSHFYQFMGLEQLAFAYKQASVIRVSAKHSVQIRFDLGEHAYEENRISGWQTDPKAYHSVAELPDPFRGQVEAAIEANKSRHITNVTQSSGSGGRGGAPR